MRSLIVAASAAATFAVLFGCKQAATPASVAPLYDSAPVETRNIEVTVDASGAIEPETTVEVKSKASGEVLAVHAEIGDVVQKNTMLIEIDKRTPKNNVAQNEAALAAAKARLAIAKTQLDRANQLYKSQTLTMTDVEKADLEFANADAQVVASQVALENAQITLEDCEVRAPVTGTILSKAVEPGTVIQSTTQAVSGGTTLMEMADLTNVQIRTRVDETDIGKVQPGMPTKVIVAAYPNQPFDGVVLKIEPQAVVEQNVTMFSVLIKIANREGLLKPGMNADVKIRIANRDSVAAVPTAALRADTDVSTSAKMLGIDESQLRQQIWPDASPNEQGATKNTITLPNGREIPLPEGVDAVAVKALMEKRRGGQELSEADRALMRKVFQSAGFGGGQGGGGFAGGGFAGGGSGGGGQAGGASGNRAGGGGFGGGPPGGFAGGGFPGGGGFFVAGGGGNAAGAAPAARPSYYQFGGDYWVIALRNDQPVPIAVKTGLTDLEYSEVVSGLQPGDRVLLLPSTSLFEQQERLQQFISSRFSSTPFQQNNNQQFRGRPF